MKRCAILLVVAVFAVLLMSCVGLRPNYLIVPGVSVGDIKADTSEQDLSKMFLSKNIIPVELNIGEGESVIGTMIYLNGPKSTLAIVWKDPILKNAPKEVRFVGEKTMWKTSEGLTLGTTLTEVEELNGKPFKLMGFGWDYEGTFISSKQGKLSFLDRADTIGYGNNGGKMLIRLQPAKTADVTSNEELFNTVLGDKEYSSSLPAMQKINPVVTEMIVYFP